MEESCSRWSRRPWWSTQWRSEDSSTTAPFLETERSSTSEFSFPTSSPPPSTWSAPRSTQSEKTCRPHDPVPLSSKTKNGLYSSPVSSSHQKARASENWILIAEYRKRTEIHSVGLWLWRFSLQPTNFFLCYLAMEFFIACCCLIISSKDRRSILKEK